MQADRDRDGKAGEILISEIHRPRVGLVLNIPSGIAVVPTIQLAPPETLPVRATLPVPRCEWVIFAMQEPSGALTVNPIVSMTLAK